MKAIDNEISIGELAEKLEMSQRTIRYYEEIGLLNSIKRIEGGRRSIRMQTCGGSN